MYFNFCFCFFDWYSIGITSSAIGLKICAVAAGIKNYNSTIKKKKKKHDKIVLLAKSKLNSIEVLISKTLIDLNVSHDEFVLISNLLKEYDDMRKLWWYEKRNKRFKDLNNLSKILVYLYHDVIVLFEV